MTDASRKYDLPKEAVRVLAAASVMPGPDRRQLLDKAAREHSAETVLSWFAEFMGLANSVAHNNRACIERFAVSDLGLPPADAERINLPTVLGALMGADLARDSAAAGRCGGCAYHISTACSIDHRVRWLGDVSGWKWMNGSEQPVRPCSHWTKPASKPL